MAEKVAAAVKAAVENASHPTQRLCNEIQLFDLCELEKCGHKKGLYCTSIELLNRFEAIAEEDERPAASGYISGDDGEVLESDDDAYNDSYDDDRIGDEGYEDDQEDE
jgi:hypothetical protein